MTNNLEQACILNPDEVSGMIGTSIWETIGYGSYGELISAQLRWVEGTYKGRPIHKHAEVKFTVEEYGKSPISRGNYSPSRYELYTNGLKYRVESISRIETLQRFGMNGKKPKDYLYADKDGYYKQISRLVLFIGRITGSYLK